MMESKPRATVEEVLDFSTSVGLPITFADIGLASPGDEVLEHIARRGTAKGETIHNEPFKVSSAMVVEALRAANDAGRDWKRKHRIEMSTPTASS